MKKVLIAIGVIIGIILLDSIQALVFDNNPILKIRDYYNGGQLHYKDKGILVDTYCGFNGRKDTVIKGFSYSLSYNNDYEIVDKNKEKTITWKLDNGYEIIEKVNKDIIKEELNKVDNLETQHLILIPSKNIGNTKYIQTYNDINVGNAKNKNEKFHIEICVIDKENDFKLMAKDNLKKGEIEKIFIDYFENNIVPDISQWYELEL